MKQSKPILSIRVSPETRRKLDFLKAQHGTLTEAVAVAVDRLYQTESERSTMNWQDRVSRYVSRTGEQMRLLTAAEQAAFPGESSVNVALRHNGQWIYADFDGSQVEPISEDGEYIPL